MWLRGWTSSYTSWCENQHICFSLVVFEDVLRFEGILSWKFILMGKKQGNHAMSRPMDLWPSKPRCVPCGLFPGFSVACGDPMVLGSEHHPAIADSESYQGIPQHSHVRYQNNVSTLIVPIVLVFHVRSQASCHLSYIPWIQHRQPGRRGPAPFTVGQPKKSDDFGSQRIQVYWF